jgi:nucleoside-diphosphate-sugar epimerase
MKCLVLGSSGQIGAALATYLKSQGHQARHFDIARTAVEDLRVAGRIDNYMQEADFVFFLAFDVGGSTYLKQYQHTFQFIDNNTRLMQVTFDALRRYNKPFIFASSQMSNMSFSSYGVLKSLGEFYAKTLGGLVVKFWNVYGLEHDPAKTHVITDFVKMALDKKEIRMRTDGEEERQFLYARDCSEALLTLAESYKNVPRDQELHITTFKWLKIIDIANIIATIVGNVTIVPGTDKDTVQQGKRNEPDPYILSLWRPRTEITEGITEIVNHYKS